MMTKHVTKKPVVRKTGARKSVATKAQKQVKKPVMQVRLHQRKRFARKFKPLPLKKRIYVNVRAMLRGRSSYGVGTYLLKDGNFITIDYDEYPDSPREWDNLGTFLTWDRRMNSPDKNNYSTPAEFMKTHNNNNGILLYVDKLDHSSISYALTDVPTPRDKWDSAIVGVMYVSNDKLRKEFNVKNITESVRNKAIEIMKGEVETYNDYVNGNVLYFRLFGPNGEEIDSCGGMYGMTLDNILDDIGYKPSDIVRKAEKVISWK